jgi:hypothetical protein
VTAAAVPPGSFGTGPSKPPPRVHLLAPDRDRTACGRPVDDLWLTDVRSWEGWDARKPVRLCALCASKRLAQHVAEYHPSITATSRDTTAALATKHGNDHHRYAPRSHRHAGDNVGPGQRPAGWRTGEDVIDLRRTTRQP